MIYIFFFIILFLIYLVHYNYIEHFVCNFIPWGETENKCIDTCSNLKSYGCDDTECKNKCQLCKSPKCIWNKNPSICDNKEYQTDSSCNELDYACFFDHESGICQEKEYTDTELFDKDSQIILKHNLLNGINNYDIDIDLRNYIDHKRIDYILINYVEDNNYLKGINFVYCFLKQNKNINNLSNNYLVLDKNETGNYIIPITTNENNNDNHIKLEKKKTYSFFVYVYVHNSEKNPSTKYYQSNRLIVKTS